MTDPDHDPADHPMDDHRLHGHQADAPCAIALLAGTLALMTGHAAPEPGAKVDADTLRRLTARKIVSNLFFLQHHPALPPGLRQVASQLHGRWVSLAQSAAPAIPPHTASDSSVLH